MLIGTYYWHHYYYHYRIQTRNHSPYLRKNRRIVNEWERQRIDGVGNYCWRKGKQIFISYTKIHATCELYFGSSFEQRDSQITKQIRPLFNVCEIDLRVEKHLFSVYIGKMWQAKVIHLLDEIYHLLFDIWYKRWTNYNTTSGDEMLWKILFACSNQSKS